MKRVIALCFALVALMGGSVDAKRLDPPQHKEKAQDDYFKRVEQSASWLQRRTGARPELIFVLTAGVDGPLELLENTIEIPSEEIPHFPVSRVEGHDGKVIFGTLFGKEVAILKGRYHYYEGISAQDVVFPYFVLNSMGAHSVITTNAVGGIREDLNAGDILCVTDHINAMGDNPLRGISIKKPGKQFTDMTHPYAYYDIAMAQASTLGIDLKEGTYVAVAGPNYDTQAEVKMFRTLGAATIGMSTVFEVIACNFLEMNVLAFCCISNPASDRHDGPLNHEEVVAALTAASPRLSSLVTACAQEILQVE